MSICIRKAAGRWCSAPARWRLSRAVSAAPLVKECGKNGNYVIGFSQANNAEPYRQHVNDELTAAAKKVPQFTLQIADGAGNVNTQTSQMDNFITQKVDLILISPFEASPLTPGRRAGDEGRHSGHRARPQDGRRSRQGLHGLHRRRQFQDRARRRASTSPTSSCRKEATWRCWKACRVRRRRSNASTASRHGVKANAKIKVVAEQAADWLPDKAQTAFAAMLQAHPEHQGALRQQRHDGGRRAARGQGRRQEGRRHQDPRHRRPAGSGRRHPRRRRRRVGGDLHLSDRRAARRSTWRRRSCSTAPTRCRPR